jgi:hypothetical protein
MAMAISDIVGIVVQSFLSHGGQTRLTSRQRHLLKTATIPEFCH